MHISLQWCGIYYSMTYALNIDEAQLKIFLFFSLASILTDNCVFFMDCCNGILQLFEINLP